MAHALSRRYKKWNLDGLLSFIPPDGHFKLLEYQVAKPAGAGAGLVRPIALPLHVKPVVKIEPGGGAFLVTWIVCAVRRTPLTLAPPPHQANSC